MRSDNIKFNDICWNTIGTCTYACVSLLMSIVIINLTGKIEGGIFSFGFSTLSRLVFTGVFFGIRPMHIVDIKYRYSFNDYVRFGMNMMAVSIVCGVAFVLYRMYSGVYTSIKSYLLIILVLHGAIDGFADYFECEYQRVNKLNMAGQSLFFRISTFAITLICVLYLTKNLLIAEASALLAEIIAFYILNIKRSINVFKTAKLDDKNVKSNSLLLEAMPLFLISFLDLYIFSASKFAVDAQIGDVASGFYALLFMPTNAIYLLMNLFMKPVLTPLSNAYHGDKKEYNKILLNAILFALCVCIIFVVGTLLVGKYYLDIIYFVTGNDYPEFAPMAKNLLLIVIVGGCFYTLSTPTFYSIVIENRQSYLLVVYIIVAFVAFFSIRKFVQSLGMYGAAYGFCFSMFLVFIGIIIAKAFAFIIE